MIFRKPLVLSQCLMLIFLMQTVFSFGQEYANEWINYAQTYYKIPVVEEGIYRLSYSDLQNANFPVDVVDPRNIQMFHRGVELSVEVTGQGDARFDPVDYIQFYGQGNDGTLDEQLYIEPAAQPHQYYNIYSDTSAYFLTWTLDATLGKRIDSFFENNVDNIPPDIYHFNEVLLINSEEYATGYTLKNYIQMTTFDYAEGWSGKQIQEAEQIDYVLSGIENEITSGVKPIVEIQLMGRDDWSHNAEILVGQNSGSLRVLNTALFDDYTTHTVIQGIEWTDISTDGNLTVRIRVLGVDGQNDLLSVNYIKLRYSQSFDMDNESVVHFNLQENVSNKSYVEIQNKPSGVQLWDITNSSEPLKLGYNNIGNDLNTIVPNTTTSRRLIASSNVLAAISIAQVNFNNFDPTSYNYIIISHKAMMKAAGEYSNVVTAYADYRASEEGGSYSPLVLDIDDIYNQFNYGEYSSLAIYQLMEYLVGEGSPEHLFIIGKGLLINTSANIDGEREYYRRSPELFSMKDYIPTAGVPGSDLTFTVGLLGVQGEVTVPTGRITSTTPEQIANYLNKVKSHESLPKDDLWRKRILHLSGGKTSQEQTRFKRYVDGFKTVAETHYLGGKITSFKKQTSAVDEFINITDEINSGLGLITFYGHSAPNITDIDIGFVSDPVHGYHNKDNYPLILVNGCNAGQIFSSGYLWGEDWVFTPDKGAIGFIADSYFGLENVLFNYSNKFYQNAFGDISLIDKSIGVIQQAVIKDYIEQYGINISSLTITQQMILEGDPAVVAFGASKPDYMTENNRLFFQKTNGQEVNALADSFEIGIIIENLGRTETTDLNVRVRRRLENSTVIDYDTVFSPVLHKDTLYVVIKNEVSGLEGRNIFEIELDYVNITDELNENNNTAVIEKVLLSNGTKNLLPPDFSVVATTNTKLITQSSSLLSNPDARDYEIQLDTVSTFDSPYKQSIIINSQALASWNVDLLPNDSLTYYWRTKFTNPNIGESDDWESSSFTYIKDGGTGWLQKHRQQYDKNTFVGLNHNEINDEFSFENVTSDISVTTYGGNHPSKGFESVKLQIDNQAYIYTNRLCRNNTLNIVAFDKTTTAPYAPIPLLFQIPQTCGRTDQVINDFTFSEMSGTQEYLKAAIDAIDEGDIVLIFSIGDVQFNNWDAALKSQIERVGGFGSTITSLDSGAPYILLGKKGALLGSAQEITSLQTPANEQTISINAEIIGVLAQGEMSSTIVGPSTSWTELFSRTGGVETDFNFEVFGLDFDRNETPLASSANEEQSLGSIDAQQYPYLKLAYQLDDPDALMPTQLNYWGISYQPVPEGILILENGLDKLSVEEGETVTLDFQYINISDIDFSESLQVNYSILNRETSTLDEFTISIPAPASLDTVFFNIEINSIRKVGLNDIILTVNPRIVAEQYYDNNQVQLFEYLAVSPDRTAPVIDVVFDGVHIENGGVVATNPSIEITVYDNNQSIYITDSSSVDLFLKRNCEGCDFERLTYNSDSITWNPASIDQQFQVLFTPKMLTDSVYTLRVIASDASGNKPEEKPYEITFTTDATPSIEYFRPYPNPFSGEINFVFEIRGDSAPDELTIDIYNTVGALVATITSNELRVGLNKINFELKDNTSPIPEGIYIYKIVTKNNQGLLNSIGSSKGKLFLHK